MKHNITVQELVDKYFSPATNEYFEKYATYLLGEPIRVYFKDEPNSYIFEKYGNKYVILGKESYASMRGVSPTKEIPYDKAKVIYKDISKITKGVWAHETLGHGIYTNFRTIKRLSRKLQYKGAHNLNKIFLFLNNIVEDIFIERQIEYKHKEFAPYIRYGQRAKLNKKSWQKIKNGFKISSSSLLWFLWFKYFAPDLVDVNHPLYDKYKKEIHTAMYRCLVTIDSETRVNRSLAFAREIYKLVREELQHIKQLKESEEEDDGDNEETSADNSTDVSEDNDNDTEFEDDDDNLDVEDEDEDDELTDDNNSEDTEDESEEIGDVENIDEEDTEDESEDVDNLDEDFKADFDYDSIDDGCDESDLDRLDEEEIEDDIEDEMLDEHSEYDNNSSGQDGEAPCDEKDACANDTPDIDDDEKESIEEEKEESSPSLNEQDGTMGDRDDFDGLDPDKNKLNLSSRDEEIVLEDYKHDFVKVKDHHDFSKLSQDYKDTIAPYRKIINKTKRYFEDIYLYEKEKWHKNQLQGKKFDVKSFVKPNSYRWFKTKELPSEVADLAVKIYVDLSGSMLGGKEVMARNALAVVSEAMSSAEIPFAIYGFTAYSSWNSLLASYNRHVVTIEMKSFSDRFSKSKNNILFMDYDRDTSIPRYHYNVDETNLYFGYKTFLHQRNETDKLIIVISDGETCGSGTTLKKVIQEATDNGIEVYGIGIKSYAVEHIYKNYMLIDSDDDLNNFPKTLNEFIKNKFIKE